MIAIDQITKLRHKPSLVERLGVGLVYLMCLVGIGLVVGLMVMGAW